ncbi:MAG: peptidase S41 [Bacteroidetes bacterium GWE2_41_25]|nr:MAG: peptidase S41 [Bacteroidetes bacterium GWA2_40_15]OFY01596.1 MAG: peptidase S41 [Bacteroidetes bacterium GWE2_41_25]HBQ83216.1 peptidase S41 [Bacteroidales bacterium]HCU19897.1 peptidase S41 [Bacteroidales bacterium]
MKRKIRVGLLIVSSLFMIAITTSAQVLNEETFKIGRALGLIESFYVDTAQIDKLAEKAIIEMLKNLDPHSTYISAKDVKDMNEPLNGNFEGIGIQFNILRDSIIVIEPIAGGPSEKVGLRAGDRILTINEEVVTGIGIATAGVRSKLMGAKGTKVNITVYRKGEKGILEFTIIRDKIPINSLDASYMLNKETGYIKLNKFAATTEKEFTDAVNTLKKSNMQNLVLDLRGNGGGYMVAATSIADKFFPDQKLLVYLTGRKTPRQDYKSKGSGSLSSTRIIVLTDENSASASEILSGALQDWDRGVIMGRRTFGKGLVQNGFYLTDGSMIRLTIARYYTPTGRLIQSPYDGGYDKYIENYYKRYTDGELMTADSIHFPDSLRYQTLVNKRVVYGGGGIMPDVFVAVDTSYNTQYFRRLAGKNILNSFTLEYFDRNRSALTAQYKNFDDFSKTFQLSPEDIKTFIDKGEAEGIKYDEVQYNISKDEILLILKGLIATNLWQISEYYQIVNQNDKVIAKALQVISDKDSYNSILGNR